MGRTVGIKAVAEAAGVSITTVSHALNGKGRLSEETRRHVREVADRLGYQPSVMARALAGGRTGMLAMLLGREDFALKVGDFDYFLQLIVRRRGGRRALSRLLDSYVLLTKRHRCALQYGAAHQCSRSLVPGKCSARPLRARNRNPEPSARTAQRNMAAGLRSVVSSLGPGSRCARRGHERAKPLRAYEP